MAKLAVNLVFFVPEVGGERVALTMESDVTLTAGLKPDMWSARVPYTEFEKLAGNVSTPGRLELWYSNVPDGYEDQAPSGFPVGEGPDVAIYDVGIVDITPGDAAQVPGIYPGAFDGFTVVEYKVTFADFRRRFTAPRGGRLRYGLVNASGKAEEQQRDDVPESNKRLNKPESRTMKFSEMFIACLKAMGDDDPFAPQSFDNIEAPKDVKWFGNHAPSELEKLLTLANSVYCPKLDGTGRVEIIGSGPLPDQFADDTLPPVTIPALDRRGRSVVFSSYPNRCVEFIEQTELSTLGWNFVIQDDDGHWCEPQFAKCLNNGQIGGRMLDHFQKKFESIKDKPTRERLLAQAYFYIAYMGLDERAGNVLTKKIDQDEVLGPLEVTARYATLESGVEMYRNSIDYLPVRAEFLGNGRILKLDRRLIRIIDTKVYVDADGYFTYAQELLSDDLKVKFAVELAEKDDEGKWRPRYFHAGYFKEAGALVKMSDSEVENSLSGRSDALFVARSDLVPVVKDGEIVNKDALEKRVKQLATAYVGESGEPTDIRTGRGFHAREPSGLVSEVHWSQDKLLTTVTLNNWWQPTGALSDSKALVDLEHDDEFYPGQHSSESERKALGATGAAQYQTPVEPGSAKPPDPDRARLAKVSDLFAPNGGFYVAALLSGPADQAGTDTRPGSKKSLSMPEGMNVAGSDQPSIFFNLMENGHASHYLRPDAFVQALRVGADAGADKASKTPILAGCVPSFEHMFWVDLAMDGGADAVWSGDTFTSPVTYTYTATVAFSTQQLGKAITPAIRFLTKVPTTPATMGLGCFLGSTFALAFTNEKPSEVACPPPS